MTAMPGQGGVGGPLGYYIYNTGVLKGQITEDVAGAYTVPPTLTFTPNTGTLSGMAAAGAMAGSFPGQDSTQGIGSGSAPSPTPGLDSTAGAPGIIQASPGSASDFLPGNLTQSSESGGTPAGVSYTASGTASSTSSDTGAVDTQL